MGLGNKSVLLLVGALALLALVLVGSDGGDAGTIVITGGLEVIEPTTYSNCTVVVRSGGVEVRSTLTLDNVTLILEHHGMEVGGIGTLRARESHITHKGPYMKIETWGTIDLVNSTVSNLTVYSGIYINWGTVRLRGCTLMGGGHQIENRGDLWVVDCRFKGFRHVGITNWFSDLLLRPSSLVVRDSVFTSTRGAGVNLEGPGDRQVDGRAEVTGCTFDSLDRAVYARRFKDNGRLKVEHNRGIACGISLIDVAEAVTLRHNHWEGDPTVTAACQLFLSGNLTPTVSNETIRNSTWGFYVRFALNDGNALEARALDISGVETGVVCWESRLEVSDSLIRSSGTDFNVTGVPTITSVIRLHGCDHEQKAEVASTAPGSGVFEVWTVFFRPCTWQDGTPVREGVVSLLNQDGEVVGARDNEHPSVSEVLVWARTSSDEVVTTDVTGTLELEGVVLLSEPFAVSGADEMALTLLDTFVPRVAVSEPSTGDVRSGVNLTVSGTHREVGSGLRSIAVRFDGTGWTEASPSGPGTWEAVVPHVPDGVRTLYANITDMVGNTAQVEVQSVDVDSTPPFIEVSEPGRWVRTPRVRLALETEAGSTATVGGVAVNVTADGLVRTFVDLRPGVNAISIEVTDRAGNVNTTLHVVELDMTSPMLEVLAPTDGSYLSRPTLSVRGRAEANASVTVNGLPVHLLDGSFAIDLSVVEEGAIELVVVATDRAGNPNRTELTLHFDWTPPTIGGDLPENGTTVTEALLDIDGWVEDESPVTLRANGLDVGIWSGSWFTSLDLTEGPNGLAIEAVDAAGNRQELSLTVYLDTTPPTFTAVVAVGALEMPPSDTSTVVGKEEALLRLTVDEACRVQLGGHGETEVAAGTTNLSLTLASGENTVVLDVEDLVGNEAHRAVFRIYLDDTPPVASAGEDVKLTAGGRVELDSGGSEDDTGIVEWTWTFLVGGGEVTLEGPSASYRFREPGRYEVHLTVRDAVGNTGTDTLLVTVRPGPDGDDGVPVGLLVGAILVVAVALAAVAWALLRRRALKGFK